MAGRDIRLAVQRFDGGARDAFNEAVGAWLGYCDIWGRRVDLGDAERVAAGVQGAARVAVFKVRSNEKARAINAGFRLFAWPDSRPWNVTGVVDDASGRARHLLITAVQDSVG